MFSDSEVAFFGNSVCIELAFLSLQNEMCLATQQLSKQLLAYEKQVMCVCGVSCCA